MPKTVTIRHQLRGCHTWSFANGPFQATLMVRVVRDTTLLFMNADMLPHRLVQVAGPKARLSTPNMSYIRAQATVSFRRPGIYRFTTRAGEDYMKGMKTIGEDNILRLTVVVT
jgi:hypothetical protein